MVLSSISFPDDDLPYWEPLHDVLWRQHDPLLHPFGVVVENGSMLGNEPHHLLDAFALPSDVVIVRHIVRVPVVTGPRAPAATGAVPDIVWRGRKYEVNAAVGQLPHHLEAVTLMDLVEPFR